MNAAGYAMARQYLRARGQECQRLLRVRLPAHRGLRHCEQLQRLELGVAVARIHESHLRLLQRERWLAERAVYGDRHPIPGCRPLKRGEPVNLRRALPCAQHVLAASGNRGENTVA